MKGLGVAGAVAATVVVAAVSYRTIALRDCCQPLSMEPVYGAGEGSAAPGAAIESLPVEAVELLTPQDTAASGGGGSAESLAGAETHYGGARPPLDLSLPEGDQAGDVTAFEQGGDRYGVGQWFERPEAKEDKLKLKSKIHLKEGANFENGLEAYDESVDGLEMGFEYKTP